MNLAAVWYSDVALTMDPATALLGIRVKGAGPATRSDATPDAAGAVSGIATFPLFQEHEPWFPYIKSYFGEIHRHFLGTGDTDTYEVIDLIDAITDAVGSIIVWGVPGRSRLRRLLKDIEHVRYSLLEGGLVGGGIMGGGMLGGVPPLPQLEYY
ncbi:hypothetical protein EJ05DRAFT_499693 [Pseudovirgaria hyperparasitica]|uniref:Uncharacterized protein n=1 Tax=Pseudovirgaria hyperparasitica TaxID=470096 RepID=A0A6A6WAS6_9PEZI|nr:uncharacterized protein EJ05DRAFT_499693 [Pseudovirgaria hyperparasitica]KAF2759279.1 hypothetical protein EJ05DRAFT_499693 [Pseudovirgaria hyperparasitica]